jgi:hypothetical protein
VAIVHLDTGDGSGSETQSEAEYVEGLRRRSAEALERAYGFLSGGGDRWNFLRAEILCEARPASALADAISGIRADDGSLGLGTLVSGGALGFPPIDAATLSDSERKIVGTLEGLLLAGDAKALHADWVEPAVACLEKLQSEDGAYRVKSCVRSRGQSPARAQTAAAAGGDAAVDPEEQEAEIFWTGMVAGILGRTPYSRPAHLQAAGAFLGARFDPEKIEHDGYPALLGFSHFYTNVDDDLGDEALQWCGRALEKGFRSRRLEAVATLRVLLTCDAQAMPGATFDVAELLERLLEEQAGDGGFAELSLAGPSARMSQTFDAMLAIVRLCVALGGE